jgi:hypothetical protein
VIAQFRLLAPRAAYVSRVTFWRTGVTLWLWRVFIAIGVSTRAPAPKSVR